MSKVVSKITDVANNVYTSILKKKQPKLVSPFKRRLF